MRILLFLLIISHSVFSQNPYPQDYFRAPLDIPLFLSGSFGELRSNHFHAGLDIKTQQKEGLPVYAAADGFVSRIKISAYGYGKAIYIDHPNGYTTVYGHLQQAQGIVADYILAAHYEKQEFEIELFPAADALPVKRGDIIALSGNSGGSGGPHLHFEFRDTKTEKVINPLFFGLDAKVADHRKPVITTLMAYPLGEQSTVNQSQRPLAVNLSLQPDGNYIADKITASGTIGFGIGAYDVFDKTYNKNGIYSIQTYSNGKPCFGYRFDTFSFEDGRYINALLDYRRFKKMGLRIQKLFMPQPYPLSIIRTTAESGIIEVTPNVTRIYKIEVSDFNNNKVMLDIPIVYSELPATVGKEEELKSDYLLKAANDNNYKKDNIAVFVPANTFYEDFYLNFDVKDNVLFFHDNSVPAHSNFTITFENTALSAAERVKTFIAAVDGKKVSYLPTRRKDSAFTAYAKVPGQFKLAMDTIAPKIKPLNVPEGKWLSKQHNLQLTISDDMSGIKEFKGYLNGQWALFEYDYKTRKITHRFSDGIVADGRNDLKIVVSDNVGNSVIFETHFFRKK